MTLKQYLRECGECERQSTDWTQGHNHAGKMAKGELRDLIMNAVEVYKMLDPNDEIPGWIASYITLSSDYIHSVKESLAEEATEMYNDWQEDNYEEEPVPTEYITERKRK